MGGNRVLSLPVPTLGPACHLVPRWRAMMLPASTISPPADFKPSRRPAESRPFREDPPAFLCAIVVLEFSYSVHRFREGIISLLLALCSGLGWLFCGRFGRLLCLAFGRFCLRFRRGGLDDRFWLALGPWRRRFRRLGSAGENFGDADHRKLVAIATLAARILAPTLLERDDLVTARMLKHLAGNGGACNSWRAELRRVPADHQHFAELDDLAGLAVDPVDPDYVLGGDPILFAARPDDCEHLSSSCVRSRCSDIPDRLLSVGLSFVFKVLIGPRKSARTQGPARHAYGGETLALSRKGARTTAITIRFRSLQASTRARPERRPHCPTEPVGSRRPTRSRASSASPDEAQSSDAACARICEGNECRGRGSSPRLPSADAGG